MDYHKEIKTKGSIDGIEYQVTSTPTGIDVCLQYPLSIIKALKTYELFKIGAIESENCISETRDWTLKVGDPCCKANGMQSESDWIEELISQSNIDLLSKVLGWAEDINQMTHKGDYKDGNKE